MNKQEALTLLPNAKIISWRDLYNGLSNRKPDASMLVEGGDYIIQECKVKGDNRYHPKEFRIVCYDSDYVERKLMIDNRLLLTDLPKNEWLAMMKKLWLDFKNNTHSVED